MFLGKVQFPSKVRCTTKEVATEVQAKVGIVWWRAMLKGLLLVAFLAAMPLSMLAIGGLRSELPVPLCKPFRTVPDALR